MKIEEIIKGLEAVPDCTCHASSYYECACDAFWPEAYIPHAATELRRLHEVNAELLAALKDLVGAVKHLGPCPATLNKAEVAIAKATGETK